MLCCVIEPDTLFREEASELTLAGGKGQRRVAGRHINLIRPGKEVYALYSLYPVSMFPFWRETSAKWLAATLF